MNSLKTMADVRDWTGSCNCCGAGSVSSPIRNFIIRLVGSGYVIAPTSGFRCEAHNKKVGGHPKSCHLTGGAVDIFESAAPAELLMRMCMDKIAGALNIIYYPNRRFFHIDIGHFGRSIDRR